MASAAAEEKTQQQGDVNGPNDTRLGRPVWYEPLPFWFNRATPPAPLQWAPYVPVQSGVDEFGEPVDQDGFPMPLETDTQQHTEYAAVHVARAAVEEKGDEEGEEKINEID